MSTPRQRGLVDELYALTTAAAASGDAGIIARVAALQDSVINPGVWDYVSGANEREASACGAALATLTGTNPLDVQNDVVVGTAEQNAGVQSLGASLSTTDGLEKLLQQIEDMLGKVGMGLVGVAAVYAAFSIWKVSKE